MTRIFWDTNLFIYLFERHSVFAPRVIEIRRRMIARRDHLFTSSLTLGEILVKPAEEGRPDLFQRYQSFLEHPAITVIPFDNRAAIQYAGIRKDRGISRPDAIQLACAASAEIDLFITNDARLSGKSVAGIKFITSLEKAPV